MKKNLLIVSLICIATLLLASGAFADEAKPCAGDIAKFCSGLRKGGGRIAKCLRQNKTQLSPACKTQLAEVKEAVKEAHQACEDDIMTYCAGVQPGGGRIMQCLKANRTNLSLRCKLKLFEVKKEMK